MIQQLILPRRISLTEKRDVEHFLLKGTRFTPRFHQRVSVNTIAAGDVIWVFANAVSVCVGAGVVTPVVSTAGVTVVPYITGAITIIAVFCVIYYIVVIYFIVMRINETDTIELIV